MLGPAVNAVAIIVCALAGKFIIRNIPERFEKIIMQAIGISLIYLGISGAMQNQRVLLLICSMIFGSVIGEMLNIDKGMNSVGMWAEKMMKLKEEGKFTKGFMTASILFCTGSMAIVGSLESGLTGVHQTLFAKSVLDGVTSVIFASQMGLGVMFSAIPVFIYEGVITLGASFMKDWFTPEIITEMSAVGSLLIAAIGFNFMGIKEIKIANMIPAIFMPWIIIAVENMIF